MRLLLSSLVLDVSGVPTYTVTLAKELERRGHEVQVFSPSGGRLAEQVKWVHSLHDVAPPDAILAQHNKTAYTLRGYYPDTPMVFSSHSYWVEEELPPRGIPVQWYTAINEAVADLLGRCHCWPVTILRDFVDLREFSPMRLLRDKPRVLYVSNAKKWRTHQRLSDACARLGLDFKAVGSPYGRSRNMQETINEFDLIVGWGRVILEGMACGRAVISYEREMGDGYLTEEMYFESRQRNFGLHECLYRFDVEGLVDQLRQYDPADGERNRALVEEHHDSVKGAGLALDVVSLAMA